MRDQCATWCRLICLTSGLLLVSLVGFKSVVAAVPNQQYQLGWDAYQQGDYEQAHRLWLPLAEQGHISTQINIGFLYDYGQGVVQDFQRAAHWYRAAAMQGSAIAQYNLGIFLTEGKIQPVPGEDAIYWLRKAADQGYADAQMQLGLLYARTGTSVIQQNDATQMLYKAGLNYLSAGDNQGALSAVKALKQIDSTSELALELDARVVGHADIGDAQRQSTQAVSTSTGTAWAVAGGYVVTNHHVIAGKSQIHLLDSRGMRIPATVVASDIEHDIALLRVDQGELPPALPLTADRARLGARVFTIGFPRVDTLGKTPKLSHGIISSVNGLGDDPTSYQISVPIQPGNSGGPLVNMRGEVVGLITTMLGTVSSAGAEPEPLPNISYALKAEHVLAMLRKVAASPTVVDSHSLPSSDDLEELADRVQRSVMIVMAE